MCYDPGVLQAYLDGEVSGSKKEEIENHLAKCGPCSSVLDEIRSSQNFCDTVLSNCLKAAGESGLDTGPAWLRFSAEQFAENNSKKGVFQLLARYRLAAAAAVIIIGLSVAFSFSSVRTAASELLTIFRVEKIKIVNITPEDISQIERAIREGTGSIEVENFGKVEVLDTGAPARVTAEEARQAVDFELKFPAPPPGYNLREISKDPGGTINLTLNTISTNQVLKSLGSEKFLPDELNGKMFSITVPTSVSARYAGPDRESIVVYQGRSPELVAPAADVLAIRDALLALPFLPDSLRRQLAAINDWQHTFIVPNVGESSKEVRVAGAEGVFISPPEGEMSNGRQFYSSLIWQKSGVVCAITGPLTLEQAQEMAASMK